MIIKISHLITSLCLLAVVFTVPLISVHAITKTDLQMLYAAGLIPKENIYLARQVLDIPMSPHGTLSNTEGIYFNTGGDNRAVTTTTTTANSSTGCTIFSTDLVVGVSGAAVTKLQTYLKDKGYFTYPEITGYYGTVTKDAVQRFQQAEGIVSSGTPATTGYGIVGPRTREVLNKLLCIDGVGTTGNDTADGSAYILGYDIDDLFNSYESDFAYDTGSGSDFAFDYNADFSFSSGDEFSSNFDYQLTGEDFAGDIVRARIGSRDAESGGVFYGDGRRMYVESKSRTVNVEWQSQNADTCSLTGNFYEGSVVVPERGDADIYLANPSARMSAAAMRANIDEDIRAAKIANGTYEPDTSDGFGYASDFNFESVFNDDVVTRPVFAISIDCREEERFGNSARDTIYIHLDEEAAKEEQAATAPTPRISGITPTAGSFGKEIFVLGTNFSTTGNTVTVTKSGATTGVALSDVVPSANGSLRFTFPSETKLSGVKGDYTITITANASGKVSNTVTYRVE